MKVLSQIKDRTFAVELDDKDFENENMIYVSHEVCHFVGQAYIRRKDYSTSDFKGEDFKWHRNEMPVRVSLGIDVRTMIELVLPYLQEHYNLQPKHIEGGNYNYFDNPITLCGCGDEEKVDNRTYISTKKRFEKVKEDYKPTGKWHVIETRHKYDYFGEVEYEDEVREYDIDQKFL